MESIEQRVKKIVAEQLGVNEAEIKNESSVLDDLGADSLDMVELVMAPRSSRKEDSFLISASLTPSCSATIFLTRCSMLSMQISNWEKFPRIIAKRLGL